MPTPRRFRVAKGGRGGAVAVRGNRLNSGTGQLSPRDGLAEIEPLAGLVAGEEPYVTIVELARISVLYQKVVADRDFAGMAEVPAPAFFVLQGFDAGVAQEGGHLRAPRDTELCDDVLLACPGLGLSELHWVSSRRVDVAALRRQEKHP
jgi:hypothetical protein